MNKLLFSIKKSFRLKLILCFLLCAVIPILAIGITSYLTSIDIAKNKIIESADLSGKQAARAISDRISQVENMADSLHFYLYTLNNTPQEPLSAYMDTFSFVRNNISSLTNAFDIYHISIFMDSDSIVSREGINFFPFESMKDYQVSPSEFSRLGVTPSWVFRQNIRFPYVAVPESGAADVLTCYRASAADSGSVGYIFGIHLTSAELSDYLKDSYAGTPVHAYLIDKNGTVIASTDASQIGSVLSKEQQNAYSEHSAGSSFTWAAKEVLMNSVHSEDWQLITEIPGSYIRQNTNILVNIILISLVIIITLTITSILFVSGSLTRKINCLSNAMGKVGINKNTDFHELTSLIPENNENGDEIDRLTVSCNNMLSALDESFHDILDLSVREERLNYQLLQSQINPHFLYNILSSVQTLLSLGELHKADKMLSDLSRFYRGLLRKSGELIPIREELEIAELYMEMESLCKNGDFDWNIRLDDGIENFLICKFTLQPILENSIHHGLSSQMPGMRINIDIRYKDDNIIIRVTDNGMGIPDDKLAEIQKNLEEKTVRYDRHFGISNINSRISSSLMEHGSMHIDSTVSKGTCVQIEIPQILGE